MSRRGTQHDRGAHGDRGAPNSRGAPGGRQKMGSKRPPKTRDEMISRSLSLLLRHKAEEEGVRLDDGGWAVVTDVVCGFMLYLHGRISLRRCYDDFCFCFCFAVLVFDGAARRLVSFLSIKIQ